MTVTQPTTASDPVLPISAGTPMQVRKRNGDIEPVDVNKIVRAVERCAGDLADVDPLRVATKTISGLYDGATTAELDQLSIQTAAALIGEEPQYSRLAARLLSAYIDKEVRSQDIASLQPVDRARPRRGPDRRRDRARSSTANARKLDDAIDAERRPAVRVLRPAHRLRPLPAAPPDRPRLVIETPQYFLLRVACGLSQTPAEAIGFYRLMSSLAYLPSSPDAVQLRHPAHRRCRPATCSTRPRDELDSIYDRYHQVARLSKFAGGIGLAWSPRPRRAAR